MQLQLLNVESLYYIVGIKAAIYFLKDLTLSHNTHSSIPQAYLLETCKYFRFD